jgi:hypothetical protein
MRTHFLIATLALSPLVACSSSRDADDDGGGSLATGGSGAAYSTGGAIGVGGVATGGVSTGGVATGGVSTGGVSTGGVGSGGDGAGGTSAGGTSTGGASTGGASTGGASTGGASTGGTGTGGTSTGGTSAGGSSTGGAGSGGTAAGGATTGGTGGGTAPTSDLPAPPTNNVAKPSGAVGGLQVLNWAGFKGAVSYTFDDSLQSQVQNYSALNATGVRMTFFLVCNNNLSNATWTQAKNDGHELANHTSHHCHDDGTGCAWGSYSGSLANELSHCTAQLMTQFDLDGVYTTAAPYGDGGYATAAQNLFFLNRGVNGGQIGPNDGTNPFSLPCKTIQQSETAAGAFNPAVNSARTAGKWQIMLVHSLGGDGGYAPIQASELISNINYTKGLGDMWIDSMVNVGAYWRAQKVFTSVSPQTSGGTTTWTWTLPAHFPPDKFLRVTVTGGTLEQNGVTLPWNSHGYYEVSLDEGSLTLSP